MTPAGEKTRPQVAWLTPQSADTLSGLNTFLKEIREALAPLGLAGVVVRRKDPGALRRAAQADVWVINSYHPGWHFLGRILGKGDHGRPLSFLVPGKRRIRISLVEKSGP